MSRFLRFRRLRAAFLFLALGSGSAGPVAAQAPAPIATPGTGRVAAPLSPTLPVRVLFDTDLGPDSDDAGALAVLHALAASGEAQILGVACSTTSPWCAPAADAINAYYGRPDLPVGTLKGEGSAGGNEEWYGESFNAYLAGHFDNDTRHGEYAEPAVALYRRLLAAAPDTSVAVVVVGPLTNLRDLLASRPDSLSPLDGRALVARKVRLLSVMGGRYPEGSESNFTTDGAATHTVAQTWPTPILFSGYEVGEEVLTGPRLALETPPGNPVVTAYHLWDLTFARRFTPDFDPEAGIWPHSSYDQTAVLAAVRGLRDYWTAVTGTIATAEDGSNTWTLAPTGRHAYLVEAMPREALATTIEDLMVTPPARP